MIVCIQNQDTLLKCKKMSIKNVTAAAEEVQRVYLRKQFDLSGVDATALAVIEVTLRLGYIDLVEEMKVDFLSETGREAVYES